MAWTHGERGDVSDDGGGHCFGTTPDGITEEKPGSGESVDGPDRWVRQQQMKIECEEDGRRRPAGERNSGSGESNKGEAVLVTALPPR